MFVGHIIKRKNSDKKNSFVYLSKNDGNKEGYSWGKTLEFKDIYYQIDEAMIELNRLYSMTEYKEDVENENIYISEIEIICIEKEDKFTLTYKNKNDYWA
ncbi:TPA: hypothetical protein PL519_003440 [Clostridium botulinum]|nr:hypothetical protein [Clostridium botulinum]